MNLAGSGLWTVFAPMVGDDPFPPNVDVRNGARPLSAGPYSLEIWNE
jgi:hypothetical protein